MRVLWNLANPDDMAKPDESVHHDDDDRTNDSLDNLRKMDVRKHTRLHRAKQAPSVKEYRKLKREIQDAIENYFSRIPRSSREWFAQRASTRSSK